MFVLRWVLHVIWIESGALILYFDPNQRIAKSTSDSHRLFAVIRVAVFDRICQSLFYCQMDAKDLFLGLMVLFEASNQRIDNRLCRCRIAG